MKSPQEQRDLTPGQLLCKAFADTFSGGGWAEAPEWENYDQTGQDRWERAAVRFSELALPEGWVAVPREPTEAMLSAGAAMCDEPTDAEDRERARGMYWAMIEAISTLPGGGLGNSVSQSQPKSTLHGAHTEAELSGAFDPVAFGESLRRVMGAKGLSVRKAAPLIGASPATINRVMRGNPPNVEDYLRICKWLSPSVAEGL